LPRLRRMTGCSNKSKPKFSQSLRSANPVSLVDWLLCFNSLLVLHVHESAYLHAQKTHTFWNSIPVSSRSAERRRRLLPAAPASRVSIIFHILGKISYRCSLHSLCYPSPAFGVEVLVAVIDLCHVEGRRKQGQYSPPLLWTASWLLAPTKKDKLTQ
jgi:hypothetical protein